MGDEERDVGRGHAKRSANPPRENEVGSAGQDEGEPKEPEENLGGTGLTFSSFVLGLSTQALMYMGEVPSPDGHKTDVDIEAAKQMIDVLAMLQEKTSRNLDSDESQMVQQVLYDLRMRYVGAKRRPGPT